MRINIFLVTILSLVSTVITMNFALAASSSIDDGFSALDKIKGGSKVTGIDAGFDALDNGSSKATGIEAGFGALEKGKSKGDAATGHGIDTGFQGVEAHRAEQAAQAARMQRIRMEQEAQKNEQDMNSNCGACLYKDCRIQLRRVFSNREEEAAYNASQRAHAGEIAEENRQYEASRDAQRRVCDAWKAAGPKANTDAFKAQLRQQDNAIAAAQRAADDSARQRDALIAQDVKRAQAITSNAEQAQRVADDNAANTAAAREKARVAANQAEQEARTHKWCMALPDMSGYCECNKYNLKKSSVKGSACRH